MQYILPEITPTVGLDKSTHSAELAAMELEEDESVHSADLVFEVEKSFFNVPSWWFEDSPVFCKAFKFPVVGNTAPDGSSLQRPFRLDGIDKADFKNLLRVMASTYGREESFSIGEWTSVLKLSTMWGIQAIKAKAIDRVFQQDTLEPLAKISLARDYGLSDELVHSLSLFTRQKRITVEDVNVLGLDYFLKILDVQERIDPASIIIKCAKCQIRTQCLTDQTSISIDLCLRHNYDYTTLLQSAFQDEIKGLDASRPEKDSKTTGMVHAGEDDSFFRVGVFFLVENCLFKGSRQAFRESSVFQDMFDLPMVENMIPEGLNKDHPIRLEGIKKYDFKQLLRFMNTRFGREKTFSLQEWTSILKLSAMWDFEEIRNVTLEHMFKLPMDVVEKIVIARDYHATKWLIPSLNEYAQLDRPISAEDVDRLGMEYLLKIVEARQKASRPLLSPIESVKCKQYSCRDQESKFTVECKFMWQIDCTDVIRSVFQDEIKNVHKSWTMDRTSTDPSVWITTGMRGAGGKKRNKGEGSEIESCNYSTLESTSNDQLDTKPSDPSRTKRYLLAFHKLRNFARKL